jgi:hypothetical protein
LASMRGSFAEEEEEEEEEEMALVDSLKRTW